MAEVLHREFVYIWYYFTIQLRQIFPYWVLGMVIGSLISVFAKQHIHHMFRSLGERKLGVLGSLRPAGWGSRRLFVCMGRSRLRPHFQKTG